MNDELSNAAMLLVKELRAVRVELAKISTALTTMSCVIDPSCLTDDPRDDNDDDDDPDDEKLM